MNKKYSLRILIALLLLSTLVLTTTFMVNDSNSRQFLPDISLKSYDGRMFLSKEIEPLTDRTVVIFFSPDCTLCEKEIGEIISCKDSFKDVRWLFITQEILKDELNSFLMNYPIMSIPNAVILLEDWPKYHTMFEVSGPPALFVYDKNGELIHSVRGSVSINIIKKWLR